MTHAYIFDTETTGFNEPQVIQAASICVSLTATHGQVFTKFYRNTKQIELGAMATHHIVSSDLQTREEWTAAEFPIYVTGPYMIGHNVDYDWEVVGKPPVKRICTLALARTFWPTLDSHSQSALMYYAYGEEARDRVKGAHNAAQDVWNLCLLWHKLFMPELSKRVAEPTWEGIWQVSEDARIPRIMTFGKYKGQSINDVDWGYIRWYLRQPDTDPYVVEAFHRVLKGERL